MGVHAQQCVCVCAHASPLLGRCCCWLPGIANAADGECQLRALRPDDGGACCVLLPAGLFDHLRRVGRGILRLNELFTPMRASVVAAVVALGPRGCCGHEQVLPNWWSWRRMSALPDSPLTARPG